MIAKVSIRLKSAILDPQGKAVLNSLKQLGYSSVENVRIGKLIEINLPDVDETTAKSQVEEMSRKLLSNPLMEDFDIQLEQD